MRERLGVVLEDGGFEPSYEPGSVDRLLGRAYRAWDSAQFGLSRPRFGIDRRKAIKDYSRGMKNEAVHRAAALSAHGARLRFWT